VERLVLCSDGITGMVDDDAIRDILLDVPDPRDAADALVAAALRGGGRDNATVIVVDVVGSSSTSYDAERQRLSLQQKLGALP
jgi:protein phosphatase